MKEVKLYYREVHMWKDTEFGPIEHITIECKDNERIPIPVIEGVAYAKLISTNYSEILAALRDTPEELAKNPDIELVYVKEKEEV